MFIEVFIMCLIVLFTSGVCQRGSAESHYNQKVLMMLWIKSKEKLTAVLKLVLVPRVCFQI